VHDWNTYTGVRAASCCRRRRTCVDGAAVLVSGALKEHSVRSQLCCLFFESLYRFVRLPLLGHREGIFARRFQDGDFLVLRWRPHIQFHLIR
jgi:hypothetical protein